MKARLISRNRSLHDLCRRVLLEFRNRDWDFGLVATAEEARGAEVIVWDVVPELMLPEESDFERGRANIFLVERKEAVSFFETLPLPATNILLKPVNQKLLHDAVAHVLAAYEAHQDRASLERLDQLPLERDDILQGLRNSNLRLQEFAQDKMRSIDRIVQESRSPLTAVCGYCSLLLDRESGPLNNEQAKILERMQRAASRLSRLTAAMFEITGGREARGQLIPKACDIEACIDQAIHEITPVAHARSITLRVTTVQPTEQILFEPQHIELALINLLDSICRFTPKRSHIEIESGPVFWDRRSQNMTEQVRHDNRRAGYSREPNAYRIELRDSIPRIQANDLEQILEELTPSSAPTDESRGLVWSLCGQIIQSYEGHVIAESSDNVAKFVFMLPYTSRKLLPQPVARREVEAAVAPIEA